MGMPNVVEATADDEDDEEILILAQAFRKAQDEDILQANHCMAHHHEMTHPLLTYYVIPLDWLKQAWGSLTGVRSRDGVPQIRNAIFATRNSYSHGQDFCLIGSNVWLLISQKFGYDRAIPSTVSYDAYGTPRWWFEVATLSDQRIPFVNGRFPYEEYVREDAVVSDEDTELEDADLYADAPEDPLHGPTAPVVLLPASTTTTTTPATQHPPTTHRRPYGSGLGNLGNTCFMNSSLQCLAHTEPLQRYFLSGDYVQHLNRDNPLGTRGELAIQFAKLLAEMYYGVAETVYPRHFKVTLGKHAEQFVGYDQHDSQELATYLLDALHEDCNRITTKPYVEKPEQKANETDQEAAEIAWKLHLKRDDSFVMEQFMGLVKSRLECPNCQRVSTTFDPFMYLSVPIPGSDLRTLSVVFASLDPLRQAESYKVSVPKLGTIEDLTKAVLQARKATGANLPLVENVMTGELFSQKIWRWFRTTDAIDQINERDEIIMFELDDLETIRRVAKENIPKIEPIDLPEVPRSGSIRDYTLTGKMNRGTAWMTYFSKYTSNGLAFERLWSKSVSSPRSATLADRAKYFGQLVDLIKDCQNPEGKRSREIVGYWDEREEDDELKPLPAIEQACSRSNSFKDVKTRRDVLILEFVARKMRHELELEMEPTEPANPDGIFLEIRLHKSHDEAMAPPFCVRVPGSMTIFDLRELIAYRLQRSLRDSTSTGESTSERIHSPNEICKVPLKWDKRRDLYSSHHSGMSWLQLGCVSKSGHNIADPSMSEEKATLDEYFSGHGMVALEWPTSLASEVFNEKEYTHVVRASEESDTDGKDKISVTDCIDKFCLREQLEETEQWYCSQCKDHVRAWKQIDIFRSPPHLIVHLKRFQFSANSHRRQKIGGFVDFPLTGLDLKNHVLHWPQGQEPIYDCYAVSNHFGGLGGGHYTAYALNGDVWCNYDDSRITTDVDPSEVVSESAYVLYYRRRDVPQGVDFEIDLQTPDDVLPPVIIADPIGAKWDSAPPSPNATMVDDDDLMSTNSHTEGTNDYRLSGDRYVSSDFLDDNSDDEDTDRTLRQ